MALLRAGLELADALVQGPPELLLLFLNDGLHIVRVLLQGRECISQGHDDRVHERMEEARFRAEDLPTIAHCPAKDSPEHVAAPIIGRHRPICQGDCQGPDVVRDDAVRHVHVVRVVVADLARVGPRAGLRLDVVEDAREHVGVVVAALVHEHRGHPLEAHAGVDALCRQLDEAAVGLAVELHEDVVPDLEDVGVVHVDEVRRVAAADAVVVDLRARATGAGLAHLPEVVLHVEGQDPAIGQVLLPDVPGLGIRRHVGLLRVSAVVRRIEAAGVDLVYLGEELPRPVNGLLLEVVAK
mmetsp:Transcript_65922/g.187259  ORF Transcript_65922/g.187259 Transcript_65922/m.187259 type:complete len:297 (+) Transcript_65922:2540-3430(+)